MAPVLPVPSLGGMTQKKRTPVLVVGYDGSRNSRGALTYAARRAGRDGVVVVSHSYGPGGSWFGAPSYHAPAGDYEARGRALVHELDLPAECRVEVELSEGAPAECLLRAAVKWEADEIVIGSRGFFPLHSGLGSVSQALLRVADRPVVIIPARSGQGAGALGAPPQAEMAGVGS
jgi:nucleotide-binding universal stress UspA family protein